MADMNDAFQPWYVCVNANKQFVNDGAQGPEFLEPAIIREFTPEDPRPAAEGKPRTVTIDGKKVPGLMMDDAGRFFTRRGKEIPLVGLDITYPPDVDPDEFSLDSGIYPMMIPAPADERGKHSAKQAREWFIDAKRVWRENLLSVPVWAK
jgi:hypothetical protein